MNLEFDQEAEKLRDEFREFLAKNLSPDLSRKTLLGQKLTKDEHKAWQAILAEKGWLTPAWPIEYGGTGWGPLERFIWDEESALAGAPRANIPSLDLLGPVIVEFGTEAQKKELLPRILSGEDWWCQGFSEPQAGSDLASLQMKAVRDGDDYIVNGTKIWTSWAHLSNKIFCLVRTSFDGPKQAGISMLLIDMEQPGVEVNPIITIGGMHAVNETQITDVRVPVSNLLGKEGDAWTITKFMLGHERLVGAGIGPSLALMRQLKAAMERKDAGGLCPADDPVLAQRVAEVDADLLALRYTAWRVLADELSGKAPGPEVSVLKIRGGEIQQAITELLMEVSEIESLVHPFTLPDSGDEGAGIVRPEAAHMGQQYFDRRKLTIYGGSSEIQRNIIARRILKV